MPDKFTRKEMRAPDAFQKRGQQAREWLEAHMRQVFFAAGATALGLLVAVVVSYTSGKTEADASKDLGGDLSIVVRPVGDERPESPLPGADKPFKTAKEKDEAIIQALTAFRASHKGTHAGASAALPLAQALYRQGRYDDALAAYQDYLKAATPDDPLRAIAFEGEGYVYEAKNSLDQALASFDQLSRENKTEFMNGMGLYHRGRVLLEEGKTQEGAKQLAEVPANAPATAAARLAQDRMALLVSQGLVVPTPPPAPAIPGVLDAG